jgi:hypothetical protein
MFAALAGFSCACGAATSARTTTTPKITNSATAAPGVGSAGARSLPKSMISIAWSGIYGSGVITAPTGTDPSLTVNVENTTSAPLAVGFDFFVVSDDPGGKRNPAQPLPYSSFSTGVWDWQKANPDNPPTVVVAPGSSAQFSLLWPRVHQDGTAVPAGRYFLLFPYTFNGAPSGTAEATYTLA